MARTPITSAAHHERLSSEIAVTVSSDRAFGIVFSVVFALVWLVPLLRTGRARWWALAVGVLFLLVALTAPRLLHPFNVLWAKLAILLHRVVSPVAMAVVFYLVFTPVGILLRALGKDPLRLRSDANADSYWIPRNPPGPPPESMVQQF
jgi:hypothetical protein